MKGQTQPSAKHLIHLGVLTVLFIAGLLLMPIRETHAISTCDFCGSGCPSGSICITDTTPQDPDCGAAGVKYCFYLSNCAANGDCVSGSCCALATDGTARCTPIELAGGVVENRVCMENPALSRGDCLEVVDQLVWTNPAREMGLDRAAEAICTNIQTAPPDGCVGLCNALSTLAEKNSTDGSAVLDYCTAMTAADGDCFNAPN